MPDAAMACFTLAVFLATLLPLLLLTRPGLDDFDDYDDFAEELPDEPIRYDHPLILDRIWNTLGGR